jgi:hypothetical protein
MGGTSDPTVAAGDYHGRPTRHFANGHLWFDVLTDAGPRIVRLGRTGNPGNVLAETPDAGWDTPLGRYELHGGHRLWFAPEDPDRVAVPDGSGLWLDGDDGGVRLEGRVEPSGVMRSIEIRFGLDGTSLDVRHELCNAGRQTLELAPWAITQLPLGGRVIMPEPRPTDEHAVRPNRRLVLWPYSSREDDRFHPRDGLLVVEARAGRNLKLGYFNEAGWVGYARGDTMLVRRFRPAIGRAHPDFGCNIETFVGDSFAELEILGPLARLAPGESAVHSEAWELVPAEGEAVDVREADVQPTSTAGHDDAFARGLPGVPLG